MKVRNIRTEELDGKSCVFKTVAEILGNEGNEQSFLFDGVVFGLCTHGEITIQVNCRTYRIRKNGLIVILPKYIFAISDLSSDAELTLLFVSFDFIHRLSVTPDLGLLKKASQCPCVVLSREKLEEVEALYLLMHHYEDNGKHTRLIKDSLAYSLVLIIASVFEDPTLSMVLPPSRQEQLTHRFFGLLFQYYESERSASFYAGKLCVTPKYLSAAIKNVSGHSMQEWINEVTLTEAKRYLRTSHLTIQQIAEKLHFASSSSFVRFFRKQTQVTPLEYRKH